MKTLFDDFSLFRELTRKRGCIEMEKSKLVKLNCLFEKMVSSSANMIEQRELKNLYQEYINEGRENSRKYKSFGEFEKLA
jgi:hypothetical protein